MFSISAYPLPALLFISLKVTVVIPASTAITEAKFMYWASAGLPFVKPPARKDFPSAASPLLTSPLAWAEALYLIFT